MYSIYVLLPLYTKVNVGAGGATDISPGKETNNQIQITVEIVYNLLFCSLCLQNMSSNGSPQLPILFKSKQCLFLYYPPTTNEFLFCHPFKQVWLLDVSFCPFAVWMQNSPSQISTVCVSETTKHFPLILLGRVRIHFLRCASFWQNISSLVYHDVWRRIKWIMDPAVSGKTAFILTDIPSQVVAEKHY